MPSNEKTPPTVALYYLAATVVLLVFALYGMVRLAQDTFDPPHYEVERERLEQCEALLGKSINLTTKCVNQRERERCK